MVEQQLEKYLYVALPFRFTVETSNRRDNLHLQSFFPASNII